MGFYDSAAETNCLCRGIKSRFAGPSRALKIARFSTKGGLNPNERIAFSIFSCVPWIRGDPNIDIARRAHVAMMNHGVAAHHQILNAV
jgi:hypothetical protein